MNWIGLIDHLGHVFLFFLHSASGLDCDLALVISRHF